MALVSLKINIVAAYSTKKMQFEPTTLVSEVCRMIREEAPEASIVPGQASEYGLFLLHHEDPMKGLWLEADKTLEHYMLRDADILEYRKIRPLRVKIFDGTLLTITFQPVNEAGELVAHKPYVVTTFKDIILKNVKSTTRDGQPKLTADPKKVVTCVGESGQSAGWTETHEPQPSKPCFTRQLTPELSLRNGDNLDLSAKVTGYPPPRITWYRDGTPLEGAPYYKMFNENGEVSLHRCTQDDGGVFACLATNDYGQDSTSSKVTVSGNMGEEVELYHPFQWDQITLPEEAQCMAVKTLLHMCGIPFCLRLRANAEYISPSGGVAFIKVGTQIVSEFDQIVEYLDLKDISLSRVLSGSQRSDMKAYMSLTTNRLYNAEVYLSWCCQPMTDKVTKARYGAPYPWPLSWILPWYKQQEAKKYLKAQEWLEKTPEEVHEELRLACKALSDKLGDQDYFFRDRPSELDALVYGHLYSLLTFQLIDDKIADIVNGYPNLTRYVQRIQEKYFVASNRKQRNTTDTAASGQC